jgi:hypothetical protein
MKSNKKKRIRAKKIYFLLTLTIKGGIVKATNR